MPLTVEQPDPHRDTRMARKLDNGHYLVCHEGDGVRPRVRPGTGKVVWTYKLDLGGRPRSPGHGPEGHGTEVFGAIRLANGNTLIAGGNNNRVLEVDPEGKIVWSIDQKELPGITLAWVTTLHVLPNGNLIVGNCHAGPDNPQLFEVTRDKKVVWTFKDFTDLRQQPGRGAGARFERRQALVVRPAVRPRPRGCRAGQERNSPMPRFARGAVREQSQGGADSLCLTGGKTPWPGASGSARGREPPRRESPRPATSGRACRA